MRYLIAAAITIICICFCSLTFATTHDFTGLPLTSDGWTDLEAMTQTSAYTSSRVVYVSTSGNDGTGEYYAIGDTEVGDNPFEPVGAVLPYLTFAAAYSELRDGYADILLFKRGDTWIEAPTIELNISGASNTARLIIGAYGNSGDRPILATSGYAFTVSDSATVSNFILTDIEAYPYQRLTSENPGGIRWFGAGVNVLVEGCYFHDYSKNMAFQDPTHVVITSKVALRRNVVADGWSTSEHSMGIYSAYQGSFLMEENVWDHNGWHETHQAQNVYTRNLYLDYYTDSNLTLRGNISARSSSEGVQMRYGGIFKHNLSLQDTAAIMMGHEQTKYDSTGEITENVVLDSRNLDGSARGQGIWIDNRMNDVEVDGNIIAHQVSSSGASALYVSDDTDMKYQDEDEPWPDVYVNNPIFTNNIVYDWGVPSNSNGFGLYIGQAAVGITFQNNVIQQQDDTKLIYYHIGTQHSGPDETWLFSGNTYYTATGTDPFVGSDVGGMTFSTWDTAVDDTDSSESELSFTDPDRTIETYATLRGLSPSDYEDGLDKFLTEARSQSRFNWDENYTAYAVINYIREGFDLADVSADYTDGAVPPTFNSGTLTGISIN